MNPFFNSLPRGMMPTPMQNMMNFMQQVQQIKRDPNQLANILQQRGMITPNQAKDIQSMGSNYEQIGHYLMNNGRMPTNVKPYEYQVNEVQSMMQNGRNQ